MHRPKVDILDHQPPTVSKIRTHSSKCGHGISKILTHISTKDNVRLPVPNRKTLEVRQFVMYLLTIPCSSTSPLRGNKCLWGDIHSDNLPVRTNRFRQQGSPQPWPTTCIDNQTALFELEIANHSLSLQHLTLMVCL